MKLFTLSLLLFSHDILASGRFDFLSKFEKPIPWTAEKPPISKLGFEPSLKVNLTPYYQDFRSNGEVRLFYGVGAEAYPYENEKRIFTMLQEVAKQYQLDITRWDLTKDGTIRFFDNQNKVQYVLKVGHERGEYYDAFGQYEVVMYHGHSRYGRGPAFEDMSNYFRMGDVFSTLEVDVRNRYFLDDPMQKMNEYPPIPVELNGVAYEYQYQGQKVDSSHLPADAYTKNIPGLDKDLKSADHYHGKQLVFIYSCSNVEYFKVPWRNLYPSVSDRVIFGTKIPGYWSSKPAVVFVMDVVTGIHKSEQVIEDLNATGDCGEDCFIAY